VGLSDGSLVYGKWDGSTEGKPNDTSGFDGIVDGALDSTVGIFSELSDTLRAADGIIYVIDSDGRAEGMSDDIIDGSSGLPEGLADGIVEG
jgi:hypothetical protein